MGLLTQSRGQEISKICPLMLLSAMLFPFPNVYVLSTLFLHTLHLLAPPCSRYLQPQLPPPPIFHPLFWVSLRLQSEVQDRTGGNVLHQYVISPPNVDLNILEPRFLHGLCQRMLIPDPDRPELGEFSCDPYHQPVVEPPQGLRYERGHDPHLRNK